jgi:hypothetical protein
MVDNASKRYRATLNCINGFFQMNSDDSVYGVKNRNLKLLQIVFSKHKKDIRVVSGNLTP